MNSSILNSSSEDVQGTFDLLGEVIAQLQRSLHSNYNGCVFCFKCMLRLKYLLFIIHSNQGSVLSQMGLQTQVSSSMWRWRYKEVHQRWGLGQHSFNGLWIRAQMAGFLVWTMCEDKIFLKHKFNNKVFHSGQGSVRSQIGLQTQVSSSML